MDTSTVTAAEIMTDRLRTTSPATHVRDAISRSDLPRAVERFFLNTKPTVQATRSLYLSSVRNSSEVAALS